ncbi:Protein of unknown function [Pseudovibrio ascidiaceicola]|uniref:DUF3445 domain-containing protein n=1 Tax=Pseudovibrio ascidiaceicola TaxID=285279 RepID=A0A1I4AHD9_9HYPH|nr:DUF3445 domain-containing protein [Pseudovibrio ascidiaceicola]SFK55794.1 Protein of unknown function [Pseudovibrio ascidiaceicola]
MSRFAHTPYDGSKRPFTVGLEPLDLREWIEPDEFLTAHLDEKERLIADPKRFVFAAEADTEAAQREVADLLAVHLLDQFPSIYERHSDNSLSVKNAGKRVELSFCAEPPLLAISRVVQEDLVLMRKGDDGYRLVAASLCFPSSWSLAEKFGGSMSAIHEGVPDFNGHRMGHMVQRIFERLEADKPVWRLNWSLYTDAELHHPISGLRGEVLCEADQAFEQLYVRVEKQTLRRLPNSGDILFTIRVHHDPVHGLLEHPDGDQLAQGLKTQLLELTDEQLDYKGIKTHASTIARALDMIAGERV